MSQRSSRSQPLPSTSKSARQSARLCHTQKNPPDYNENAILDDNASIRREKLIKEASDKLVLYLLHHLGNKKVIRRQEIYKQIGAVQGVAFNKIIDAANGTLQNVYGYELIIANDNPKNQPWFLIRKLTPAIKLPAEINLNCKRGKDKKQILTFLVLTHVFMSDKKSTEGALHVFLQRLKFDIDDASVNGLFGSVRGHLDEMLKAKLINIEEGIITWGVQAEMLVSKVEILEFVSKLYKNRIEGWGELYNQAVEQAQMHQIGDNEKENE